MERQNKGDLVSAYEFAKHKNVNVMNIYRLIDSGTIITEQIGKTKYFSLSEYDYLTFPKSTGERKSVSNLNN